MKEQPGHQKYFIFISRLTELFSNSTIADLRVFLKTARRGFPSVVPLLEASIKFLERTGRESPIQGLESPPQFSQADRMGVSPQAPHLFDLLRSKELFPSNNDLADFASRILPGMTRRRFDKMSRADIAGRIIEYMETLNSEKRQRLERSMRNAMASTPSMKKQEVRTFFSEWEKIIKGLD